MELIEKYEPIVTNQGTSPEEVKRVLAEVKAIDEDAYYSLAMTAQVRIAGGVPGVEKS
jgi:hypothetical protein